MWNVKIDIKKNRIFLKINYISILMNIFWTDTNKNVIVSVITEPFYSVQIVSEYLAPILSPVSGLLSTNFSRVKWNSQPEACNFIKKETLAQVFSCEFCEISKSTFFTEHLCTTASAKTFCLQSAIVFLCVWKEYG